MRLRAVPILVPRSAFTAHFQPLESTLSTTLYWVPLCSIWSQRLIVCTVAHCINVASVLKTINNSTNGKGQKPFQIRNLSIGALREQVATTFH